MKWYPGSSTFFLALQRNKRYIVWISDAELGTHAKNKQNTFYERKLSPVWMLISRSDVHLMEDNFTDSFPFKIYYCPAEILSSSKLEGFQGPVVWKPIYR